MCRSWCSANILLLLSEEGVIFAYPPSKMAPMKKSFILLTRVSNSFLTLTTFVLMGPQDFLLLSRLKKLDIRDGGQSQDNVDAGTLRPSVMF